MAKKENSWSIIVHGGAHTIHPGEEAANRSGVAAALEPGRALLQAGGTALEAVEAVVRALEDNPTFNAGRGSVKNAEGEIEMDASIMDGTTLDIGAVGGLQDICHPISVARALLRDKTILLVGEGAQKFADQQGFERLCPADTAERKSTMADTVGCVARDRNGHIVVGTSTGGLEGARVGRVGDVPLPGCGFYADDKRGGASLSGDGEAIARVMLAAEVLKCMEQHPVEQAVEKALLLIERVKGEAGVIAISAGGEICWGHNSSHFAVAYATEDSPQPKVFLRRDGPHEQ